MTLPEKKQTKILEKKISPNKLINYKKSAKLSAALPQISKINNKIELNSIKSDRFQKENHNAENKYSFRQLLEAKRNDQLENSNIFNQSSNIKNIEGSLNEGIPNLLEKSVRSSSLIEDLEDTSLNNTKYGLHEENLQKAINRTLSKYQLSQSFWGKWMENKKQCYSNYDLLNNMETKLDESLEIKKFKKEYK